MPVDFYLGDWLVQPALNRATNNGRMVHLRPKVMDLLIVISAHPGVVLSKDALLEGAWKANLVSESALTSVVAELRQVFDDDVEEPWLLQTIPKRGYRLIAEVRQPVGTEVRFPPEPIAQEAATAGTNFTPARSSVAARVLLMALALATVVVFAALWPNSAVIRGGAPIRDIAVLPFENPSGNPADELLAHAITDGLISELARLDGFRRVIAHESVMRYRAPRPPLRDIANDLHVQGFIAGTLTRTDGRTGVRVELIDARSEGLIWSATFMPDTRTVEEFQRRVVRDIVREARINVTPRQRLRLEASGQHTRSGSVPGGRQRPGPECPYQLSRRNRLLRTGVVQRFRNGRGVGGACAHARVSGVQQARRIGGSRARAAADTHLSSTPTMQWRESFSAAFGCTSTGTGTEAGRGCDRRYYWIPTARKRIGGMASIRRDGTAGRIAGAGARSCAAGSALAIHALFARVPIALRASVSKRGRGIHEGHRTCSQQTDLCRAACANPCPER